MAVSATRPDHAKIERDLAAAVRRHEQRAKALKESEADRDNAIRAAIEAKLPRARIVTVTQLSPQRIDQIRRSARY